MQYFTFTALAALATSAHAALIQVAVGKDGLTYTPSAITAAVGDLVEFSFYPKALFPFFPLTSFPPRI
jgi:plastocyanin